MLYLHHSNQLEKLVNELLASYKDGETHPFTPRTIITESSSLARWLKIQFCKQEGISCLLNTTLPAEWLWKQTRIALDLPHSDDPLARDNLHWRIHAALDPEQPFRNGPDNEFTTYLADDTSGLKRWLFAEKLADLFDRYQYYRPELTESWSAGSNEESPEQANLWRAITEELEDEDHRVKLMRKFLIRLNNDDLSARLPDRLDLFASHALPPLLMDAIAVLSQHIPVHFWLLTPTEEYWADLSAPREMARQRLKNPDTAELWQAGCPLLTQWGRQGQIFQDILFNRNTPMDDVSQHFNEPARKHLLGCLQNDIFHAVDTDERNKNNLENKTNTLASEVTPSIQIHACHGPMRECQVLRDQLLRCLNNRDQNHKNKLQPEDILVMVPQISRYAPYIKAVFGQSQPRLPFRIYDASIADEHPITRAFLSLLNLPCSRFTRADVLDLAQIPEVYRRFGLAEGDIDDLSELFERLRVYWGLDGEDKLQRLNLPAIKENTWHHAFSRVMAGYALGDDESWGNIAPCSSITAQAAQRAAGFFDLLQTMRDWSQRLDKPRTPVEWESELTSMSKAFFKDNKDEDSHLARISETIAELTRIPESACVTVGLPAMRHWLQQQLESASDGGMHFYSGGITFCGMKPLRGVPFSVIALLGMQETDFPRRRPRLEFDLMQNNRKFGDPDPVQEDRYLMLEILLAARKQLIISYTGRDSRTNNSLPPSILVQELIDYIQERYTLPWQLITEHPLQAFSLANFGICDTERKHAPEQPGFDAEWLQLGKIIQNHTRPQKGESWPEPNLRLAENFHYEVSVDQLARFLAQPIRQFIQRRLKIYKPEDNELQDNESFALNGLDKWTVGDQLLQNWLTGIDDTDASDTVERLRAEGMLPHGAHGDLAVATANDDIAPLLKLTEALQGKQPEPVEIDLTIHTEKGKHWQITGNLRSYYPDTGIVHITASSFKPANLLKLWIEHLCLHAAIKTEEPSQLFSKAKSVKDRHYTLLPIEENEALRLLKICLAYYETGLTSPLAILPEVSYEYINLLADNKEEEEATRKATDKLNNIFYPDGDRYTHSDKYFHDLLLRHHKPVFDSTSDSVAKDIMRPLVDYIKKDDKKKSKEKGETSA